MNNAKRYVYTLRRLFFVWAILWNIYINPPSPVLFLFETAHTIATEIISFSVGSTSNIPEVKGEPKCLESSLGPAVAGVCVDDITVLSGVPIYSNTEFQNEIAVVYETSSITDIDTNTNSTIAIDSTVLKFSSNDEDDKPNEISFGGLATKKQLKWIVVGGFGKYEGATGYIEFENLGDTKAGLTFAIYHLY